MRIRTYKVVPLKRQTGVIEWVLETIPLLGYLERTHISVNPTDWKWIVCRNKILSATHFDHVKRLTVYKDVCAHFNPVLRHFFLEYFKDPDAWFSKRISYSRSVAASSMIGHVLGLGDRHGQNILLDKQTGEVVHIDLGVAFEQVLALPRITDLKGTMLPVPEAVPFRLTRDIVDGFGISGCEGPFIRASTFALTVFREEEDTISTFLDVLKYDPLYNWYDPYGFVVQTLTFDVEGRSLL
jgi:ataxia telangiectasia mutated family protein